MDNKKNSGDGAENNLAGRQKKQSVKMGCQGNVTGNTADHPRSTNHTAPSDESTTSASSANSSKMMAQRRSSSVPQTTKEFKALRGRVFDDMYNHFCGHQHVDPSVRSSNTSLAHLGRGEMWFGDLDFSADADALLGQSNVTRSSSLPTMPSPQPVLSLRPR